MFPSKKHSFKIPGYDTIRNDRSTGQGGGAAFLIKHGLPTSSHNDNEFLEYFDYLWALYDSLSVKGYVIVMGDCKGDLGNSLGERNQRGCKIA